eukprot:121451-Rhodomonas_salina.1
MRSEARTTEMCRFALLPCLALMALTTAKQSTDSWQAQAQMCAREWAAEFNNQSVPKPIDFVPGTSPPSSLLTPHSSLLTPPSSLLTPHSLLFSHLYSLLVPPPSSSLPPPYVFELVDRPGRPLIGVEEFVEGVFIKHNNNVGGIMTAGGDSERATPNAFRWRQRMRGGGGGGGGGGEGERMRGGG